MRCRSPDVPLGLGLLLALAMPASAIAAQSCTLEYYRADNMWEGWGSGNLGAETITLQPGQKKSFATDWAFEKKRNDGTSYYGSHLRLAVNRGTGSVQVRIRGPMLILIKPAGLVLDARSGIMVNVNNVTHYVRAHGLGDVLRLGGLHFLRPGDMAVYRHDLAEIGCPGSETNTTPAPLPEPPPQPVLLSLTGTPATATTTTIAVTVAVQDAKTNAPLTGQVTINGVTGATGEAITYNRCSDTIEFEDTRGVTRTRTIRVPCEGTVKIAGYPDTYFTF